MTRRIDTYLQDCIEFLRRKKRVEATEFKAYVESEKGSEISPGRWHNFTKHLKNAAVVGKNAAIPFDNQWHWNPPIKIVFGWVGDVLQRHMAEILLCCDVLQLPRYKGQPYSEEVVEALTALRDKIDDTLSEVRMQRVRPGRNRAA